MPPRRAKATPVEETGIAPVPATKTSKSTAKSKATTLNATNSSSGHANKAASPPPTKGKKQVRRKKKKHVILASHTNENHTEQEDDVQVEYVAQDFTEELGEDFQAFADVFARFQARADDAPVDEEMPDAEKIEFEEVAVHEEEQDEAQTLSKTKAKRLTRMSVAQLKQLVAKPDVVEWIDVTAADPLTLTYLKGYRNSVPVPRHWSQKKKYLQNKRGVLKPPFDLPDYIKATGIMQMRQTGGAVGDEGEDTSRLKNKTRERRQPKMGRLDLDYQKLHDAFFKWQTKPKMSQIGDTYYEGKEFETNVAHCKPGQISPELRDALSMGPTAPPPWLINQQRYGPPPSYPALRIPGLNAPIPAGAQWGFQPGGWGRPPVDEWGRGLYGDVFGHGKTQNTIYQQNAAHVERTLWGEMEEQEEESEEEVEEVEEEVEEPQQAATEPDEVEEDVEISDLEPEVLEIRKERRYADCASDSQRRPDRDEGPKQLYQVIPDKATQISGFMGSERVYDLSKVQAPVSAIPLSGNIKKRKADEVEVSLNPDVFTEDGLDADEVLKAYESKVGEKKGPKPAGANEDLSDLMEEHAKKAQEKRKRAEERRKEGKKKDSFKF